MADEASAADGREAVVEPRWDDRIPPWQRWLNHQCEGWIFAILIALVIRHFVFEPFRIPSASMEPMLYGDPALSQGDFVVVDKIAFRFTGAERWGVTVFQYPVPEINDGWNSQRLAWNEHGRRLENFFTAPSMERNFVKRCVVMPGDRFYFANGALFLEGEEGWGVADKPPAVQEALWMPIYDLHAQAVYEPWEGEGGASAKRLEDSLRLDLGDGGTVRFTQPFNNLYFKPGEIAVDGQIVEASMLEPWVELGDGRSGSLWNVREWDLRRITSADRNRPERRADLNEKMDERIGDIRCHLRFAEVGDCAVELREGEHNRVRLTCGGSGGWSLVCRGEAIASGTEDLAGREIVLICCDDRLVLLLDGEEVAGAELEAVDPELEPLALSFTGSGSSRLERWTIDRDIHYNRAGILENEAGRYRSPRGPGEPESAYVTRTVLVERTRQAFIDRLIDEDLGERLREAMEGDELRRNDAWLRPIGISPATALEAPDNGYLLLGDNSPVSFDSRNWGWVPEANLRGEVWWVVFPFSRWRTVE